MGDGYDTGTALPRPAAQVLSTERVAFPASLPITAEKKAERLARMAALARAIRVDAAKLLSDQILGLQTDFISEGLAADDMQGYVAAS